MEYTKLIQLNEIQLGNLINSQTRLDNQLFIEGAIPPVHVLIRSLDLFHHSVDVVWAFPYFIQKNNLIMGCCGFKEVPYKQRIEIGFNVAPEARGLGVATSAVRQLSQIAFSSDLVNTVVALISSQNKASLNVVIKNGFSFKKLVVDGDGEELECWELNNSFKPLGISA